MKPVLQSLVLADRVYEDATTHKKIISGTFNNLVFSRKPLVRKWEDSAGNTRCAVPGGMHSGSPWAYVSLTDLQGAADFQLRYVDLQNDSVLLETKFQVTSRDRLDTAEIAIPMPMLPTPHPGVYALELLHNSEILGSLRINVKQLIKREEPQGDD